jgi:hypothetical protein
VLPHQLRSTAERIGLVAGERGSVDQVAYAHGSKFVSARKRGRVSAASYRNPQRGVLRNPRGGSCRAAGISADSPRRPKR